MARSPQVAVRDLVFTHDGASSALFAGLTAAFPVGFTGIVGANGCGKTTLLELLAGLRTPDAGEVCAPGLAVHCPQRTDDPPDDLEAFLAGDDAESWVLRGRLGVEAHFAARWRSLSHGERKRAQIATALWRAPDLLAIDEPTNHVDGEARALLERALAGYRGVGVLVSHDRALLDALCGQCLWLEASEARLVPGGYTKGREVLEEVRSARLHAHEQARRERDRLAQEVFRRREEAAGSARRLSKRGISAKDHDAKGRVDAARLTGKGTAAGRRLQALDGHVARADARVRATRVDKRHATGVQFLAERSHRDAVLQVEAGALALDAERVLHFPALRVAPDDRHRAHGAERRRQVDAVAAPAGRPRCGCRARPPHRPGTDGGARRGVAGGRPAPAAGSARDGDAVREPPRITARSPARLAAAQPGGRHASSRSRVVSSRRRSSS